MFSNNSSSSNPPQQQDNNYDFKQKRDQFTQNVRKTNREEKFKKMRNIIQTNEGNNGSGLNNKKDKQLIVDNRYAEQIQKFLSSTYTLENFNELLQSILSEDILRQHYGLIGIRKILSIAENPPIQPVIDAGLVPKMIEYVKQNQYPQLQLQATWALTNVASGTTVQCQSIIDKGGIPLFVELLKNNNTGIVEQAIWAIGNIASDCVFYRDNIIRNNGVKNLVAAIQNNSTQNNIVKHGAWSLSNLCRGNPLPKYDNIKEAIPVLCSIVAHDRISDKEILADCSWAISYHSDAKKNKIEVLMQCNIVPVVLRNMSDSYLSLVVPSIRILGNVSTGTTAQTDEILKNNGVEELFKVLLHPKKVVRRQVCWVISNICAGSRAQVQAVFSKLQMVKKLLELFETEPNDVRRQICYIFSNISHNGDPEQIYKFYKEYSIIRYYIDLLGSDDAKTVEIALETLFVVLDVGNKIKGSERNPLVQDLYSLNAIDKLEGLQYHDSEIVYRNVSKLLQAYFEVQDPLEL